MTGCKYLFKDQPITPSVDVSCLDMTVAIPSKQQVFVCCFEKLRTKLRAIIIGVGWPPFGLLLHPPFHHPLHTQWLVPQLPPIHTHVIRERELRRSESSVNTVPDMVLLSVNKSRRSKSTNTPHTLANFAERKASRELL